MTRPWIKPDDVRNYSSSDKVKERLDEKLKVDIARAEAYVIYYTHNDFTGTDYATKVPDDIRIAVTVLAEAYAKQAILQKNGSLNSETFDDYSYTASTDTETADSLGLGVMLDPYKLDSKGTAVMRLRKL